ncbi:hypothetical protein QYM36_017243 [Artemia franciscana]|uniref:Large ribosomal subunit protein uL24m n=1 Tax=Artemia franciscana TaxID=6661 RepID=A0AA88KWY5_ARTSF|nr:hypothetical protein QYM36_017243 [Artemia franciscana]
MLIYPKGIFKEPWTRSPRGFPQFREIDHKKKNFWFTMNRPWTEEFQRDNNVHYDIPIQPLLEWSFFRGDLVEIMVGPDKGKQGHVNYIVEERNWICVEGLNCKYSTVGKEKDYPGMMVKEEKPLLVTNEVKLVDPSDNKPTDVEWRFLEDGSKIRISTRTGREIPIPLQNEETIDYKTKATYKEQPKDTPSSAVEKLTFKPKLATFEMDLMEEYNIKEERVPKPTFWY